MLRLIQLILIALDSTPNRCGCVSRGLFRGTKFGRCEFIDSSFSGDCRTQTVGFYIWIVDFGCNFGSTCNDVIKVSFVS